MNLVVICGSLLLGGAVLAHDTNRSITAGCPDACQQISTALKDDSAVHYPANDPDFRIWDAKQAESVPACRVEPSDIDEVAQVLDLVVENWCTFAIKGGGHSRAIDASNSKGGVTIDMKRFDKFQVTEDRETGWIGAGLTLLPTYRAAEAEGLSFVGGRSESVGVAGYTMGGGFSNLTPKLGLAVDNVMEYELVLPNSTAINVTYEYQPDLYYALRGGANNFGIVTRFRVRTVPQGQQLFGHRQYDPKYSHRILEEAHRLATDLANDTDMAYWSRYAYKQSSDSFATSLFLAYLQPENDPPVFDSVNDIPSEVDSMSVDWFSNHIDSPTPFGLRHLFTTVTYTASAQLERRIWDIFESEVASVKHVVGFESPNVVSQPIPAKAMAASKERGGSALGLEAPNDVPLQVSLLTFGWSHAEDDAAMYKFAHRFRARSEASAKEMGLWNRYLYINYCMEDADPFAGYGEENKLKLQRIQREVDKAGVFRADGLNRGNFKLN